MISVFWAAGIYGSICIWLAYRKKKEGIENYNSISCIAGYLISRIILYLLLEQPQIGMWHNILIDAVIFGILCFLTWKTYLGMKWEYVWLYVSNPVVMLALFSLKKTIVIAVAVMILLAVLRLWKIQRWERHILSLYRYYAAFTMCGMAYLIARVLLSQSGAQCAAGDGEFPIVWILAVCTSLIVLVHFLYHIIRWSRQTDETSEDRCEAAVSVEEKYHAAEEGQQESFSGKDVVWLILLTGMFALMAFSRLGSTRAPQTYVEFNDQKSENREMVLRFGQDTEISSIEIFLGAESKRSFSFSFYDFEKNCWEVFDSAREITSVFEWNTVNVNRTIRTLGIVCLDSKAYVNEIVILDKNGKRVLPANVADYANVFDEQELYHKDLSYYDGTMFDEVYHARTAYEFVHKLPVYEITHPPLGKLLISLGIRIFGMTPFGWRVVCALMGTMMVPFVYLFARKFSGRRKLAVFTTLVFNLEFMHLTLSRIATLDIIVAFFVLLMFYFMYLSISELRSSSGLSRRAILWLLLCGCSSACAVATKWTGFYALAGIAVLFLGYLLQEYAGWKKIVQNRTFLIQLFGVCVISFIIIPAAVYFLSYIPYTWCGNPDSFWQITIDNFKLMLSYHKKTVFDHPYSSEWYEWIWNKRPLLDALDAVGEDKVSSVATFVNPVICWGGIAALLHNIYLWRCREDKTAAYLCIIYAAMLLPWLFIHRTVFIYQYYICSNVLVLLLGNSFAHIQEKQGKAMKGFLLAAAVVFIMFYPVLTGYPVAREYVNQGLEWLRSWGLA